MLTLHQRQKSLVGLLVLSREQSNCCCDVVSFVLKVETVDLLKHFRRSFECPVGEQDVRSAQHVEQVLGSEDDDAVIYREE